MAEPQDARIDLLREHMHLVLNGMSGHGGQIQALLAAMMGVLTVLGEDERVMLNVTLQLESCIAANLARSDNDEYIESFETTANLLKRAVTASQRKRAAGQGGAAAGEG